MRGEVQAAHQLAEEELALAQSIGNLSIAVEAQGNLGIALLHLGQWQAARVNLEQAIAKMDSQGQYASLLDLLQPSDLAYRRHLTVVLWHLGYPDQALEQMTKAIALAQAMSQTFELAGVLTWSAFLHTFRREVQATQTRAAAATALAKQRGFLDWIAYNTIFEGWAMAQQGQVKTGIARIEEGLADRLAIDARLRYPTYLSLLAEAYGQAGKPEQGLCVVDEALNRVEATGERFSEAELHRLKGELLQMQRADNDEIESCFLHALDIARRQEAKSLELRAAMSLSRLWQTQGRAPEARQLLAEIYGWFSEGFDTADLQEAKALLAELC
jgi:predicted ATPase